MMRIVAAILCICGVLFVQSKTMAQKETWTWWFGDKIALKFDDANTAPRIVQISNQNHSGPSKVEGCASISDKDGNLLFFTDGRNIFDKEDNLMPNGGKLSGSRSSTQGAMIVKQPGKNENYYVFTSPPRSDTNEDGLNAGSGFRYTVVDMSKPGNGTANDPFGEVSTKDKQLFKFSPEKVSATTDETCNNVWVMGYDGGSEEFKAYKLSDTGLDENPVITPGPLKINNGSSTEGIWGNMEFSPDGEKLAVVFPYLPWEKVSGIYLYDFNKATGELTGNDTIVGNFYCVAFSSNNNVLYATVPTFLGGANDVYQFDLEANDIGGSKKQIHSGGYTTGHPKLGPDGKIYIPRSCDNDNGQNCQGAGFSIINDPNNVGNPGYQDKFLNAEVAVVGYGSPEMLFVSTTELELEKEHTDTECRPEGTITVKVTGGTLPYNYLIITEEGDTIGSTDGIFKDLWSGKYKIIVKDAQGCLIKDSVEILDTAPELIEDLLPTADTCGYCTGTITVNPTGKGTRPFTYFLIQDGDTIKKQEGDSIFTELCIGDYEIVLMDFYKCRSKDKIKVPEVIVPIPIEFPPMGPYCLYGEPKTLKSIPAGGIWSGTGVTDGENGIFDPKIAGSGKHVIDYVYVDQKGKCKGESSIEIEVTDKLTATIDPIETLCEDAPAVTLVGRPEDGTWYLGGVNGGLVFSGTFNPGEAGVGTHLIEYVIEDGQCGDTTATNIEVVPLPEITVIPDRKEGCSPLEVNFTNTSDPAAVKCIWDLGNGETSTDCAPKMTYLEVGCYDVTLTTETSYGCRSTKVEEDLICVHPDPEAEFTADPTTVKVTNPVVHFTNQSTLNYKNFWVFADQDTSDLIHPTYRFPEEEGVFPICLKVTTEHGCVDSICHEITIIDEFFIYVPNAFTPNNDGVNDNFFPVMRGYSQDDFKMQIYNRWGEILYLSKDPEARWDGTYRGKDYSEAQKNNKYFQKQEVYIWKIKAKDKYTGKVHRLMGHVTLMR